ncbi:MAG: alanine/glycine:cation symporter family protein [Fusobacteriaceae bacterium]
MTEFLNVVVNYMNDILWGYILIAMLIVIGTYFTVITKFAQFKHVGHMFKLLADSNKTEKGEEKKGISSFQAFCISTASRVGTGNLAGVATAIATGGPGAIFWMWLIAFIGGASSFVESTLAQVYKIKDGDSYRGGPAYYMEKALNKKWMGVAFSILITIAFGLVFNSVQSNTISIATQTTFSSFGIVSKEFLNISLIRWISGIILSLMTGVIIFGGVNRIAKFSSIVVPVMAIAYIIISLFVVIKNISLVPAVFKDIVSQALGLKQVFGGGLGAAIMIGVKRGLFSNEAGMGSAPNAAATAETSHPVKQGFIQTLGVFTDTIIICSCTAFMILVSGAHLKGFKGIELTQKALSSQVGQWGNVFIAVSILLFAFSSVIGNYYYGETNIEFLTDKKIWVNLYRMAVIGMVMFGAVAEMDLVWNLADLFMGLMAILNLIAIFALGKVAVRALEHYLEQKKAGIEPFFHRDSIELPNLHEVECWEK